MSSPEFDTSEWVRQFRNRMYAETQGMCLDGFITYIRKALPILEKAEDDPGNAPPVSELIIDAVAMVRAIRNRMYEEIRDMTPEEYIEYIRQRAAPSWDERKKVRLSDAPDAPLIFPDWVGDRTICYVVEDPSLPGCVSYAETPEEALEQLEDARKAYRAAIGYSSGRSD